MHPRIIRLALCSPLLLLGAVLTFRAASGEPSRDEINDRDEPHRSPIALALATDGSRLLTANQTAGTVSLVDPNAGTVLDELSTGDRPAGVALSADGRRGIVTHWYGGDVAILEVEDDSLKVARRVEVGPEPRGVVLSADGKTAYVAVGVSNEVARLDMESGEVNGRLPVGREPRGLALTADGSRLLVGNARSGDLSVISTRDWTVERTLENEPEARNLRQVAIGPDGKGYVVDMRNRGFATTRNNIDLGWVLGQRLVRVDLDGEEIFETLSLDPRGLAAADVHGLAINPTGTILAISSGGTHEVLLFRTDGKRLPWRRNGSRDLMAPDLVEDESRFRRVPLGGRPTELAFAP